MSWKSAQWQPNCSTRKDGRTYGQTDMRKLRVATRNFANPLQNIVFELFYIYIYIYKITTRGRTLGLNAGRFFSTRRYEFACSLRGNVTLCCHYTAWHPGSLTNTGMYSMQVRQTKRGVDADCTGRVPVFMFGGADNTLLSNIRENKSLHACASFP